MADAANTDTLMFELISPGETLMKGKEHAVTLPGWDGEFMVLPQHTQLVAMLGAGAVKLHDHLNAVKSTIFITGGFADVAQTHCAVLADDAVLMQNINKLDVEEELKQLEARLSEADDEQDALRIQDKINILSKKLECYQEWRQNEKAA